MGIDLRDVLSKIPKSDPGTPAGTLGKGDWKGVGWAALGAGAVAAVTYLVDHLGDLQLGVLAPLAGTLLAAGVDALRRFFADTRK